MVTVVKQQFQMRFQMAACCFFFILLLTSSQAQRVPALYLFGDSLLDVGNNNFLERSHFKCNYQPYGIDYPGQIPTGRYSNGRNTADYFAEKLGVVSPPPYLSLKSNSFPITGVNFASGRATILNVTGLLTTQFLPLSKQVEYYTVVYQALVQQIGYSGAHAHLSESLVVVNMGANDLSDYFFPKSYIPKKTGPPQAYVDSMILALKEALKIIYNRGARKFAMLAVVHLNCPANSDCEANKYVDKYNQGLKHMLKGLQSQLKDLAYSYTASDKISALFVSNPSKYGFAEVKTPCCGSAENGCQRNSPCCLNRSDHVLWDPWHPSETACQIFVNIACDGSQSYTIPSIDQLIAT